MAPEWTTGSTVALEPPRPVRIEQRRGSTVVVKSHLGTDGAAVHEALASLWASPLGRERVGGRGCRSRSGSKPLRRVRWPGAGTRLAERGRVGGAVSRRGGRKPASRPPRQRRRSDAPAGRARRSSSSQPLGSAGAALGVAEVLESRPLALIVAGHGPAGAVTQARRACGPSGVTRSSSPRVAAVGRRQRGGPVGEVGAVAQGGERGQRHPAVPLAGRGGCGRRPTSASRAGPPCPTG